jgi:hypothetical protein
MAPSLKNYWTRPCVNLVLLKSKLINLCVTLIPVMQRVLWQSGQIPHVSCTQIQEMSILMTQTILYNSLQHNWRTADYLKSKFRILSLLSKATKSFVWLNLSEYTELVVCRLA